MEQNTAYVPIDWPMGTAEERLAARGNLPGDWKNSNPFGSWYEISKGVWNWHTGVDLNLNTPTWNADWHKPLYAIADGKVVFAGVGGGSWGHIIVCQHVDPLTGRAFYSRYGHVENTLVKSGDSLTIGQQIAQVGNADGFYGQTGAHLHLDICITDLLSRFPNQWPGINQSQVLSNYVDPVEFIGTRYRASQNQGSLAALHTALAKLPGDAPVTLILGTPSASSTAFVVSVKDLGFTTQPDDSTPPTDPTPPDQPPPVIGKKMVVTAPDGLNVRRMPSISSESIGVLPCGSTVNVIESGTPGWMQLAAKPPDPLSAGYVSTKWLSDNPVR